MLKIKEVKLKIKSEKIDQLRKDVIHYFHEEGNWIMVLWIDGVTSDGSLVVAEDRWHKPDEATEFIFHD